MLKTAFITAFNPGNMGMYTVDRAISDIWGKDNKSYTVFCAHSEFKTGHYKLNKLGINIGHRKFYQEGIVRKLLLRDKSQLKKYDRVIFWGDFTLNPEYGLHDFVEYDLRYNFSRSENDSYSRWKNLFMLNSDEHKIMSFGQNFQSEKLSHGGTLSGELQQVIKPIGLILPRDSKSFKNLKGLNLSNQLNMACDAALLKIAQSPLLPTENHFCFYFSRSNFKNPKSIISKIEKEFKIRAINLNDWNYCKVDYEKRWNIYEKLISNSKFILTDTYHCAVNSISLKTIPMVISNPVKSQSGTLGDFKKQVLMSDFGFLKYYFETNDEGILDESTISDIRSKIEFLNSGEKRDHYENFNIIEKKVNDIVSALKGFTNE